MGNFYTNITLRTKERASVINYMRSNGRACFVSPTLRGFTSVFERRCDEQDVNELEALASELSAQFRCLALAVLNHDDDILWIGTASNGEWVTTYRSDQILSGNAWKLAREFRILGLFPLVWLLMRTPIVLFEIWRHTAIAFVLGIPDFTVGFGYKYLSRGEKPSTVDQFENVG